MSEKNGFVPENYPHKQPNSDYCFICGRENPFSLYVTFYDNGQNEVFAEKVVPKIIRDIPASCTAAWSPRCWTRRSAA
jgi:hypothetical protein